jgi:futalosine hydrolase
VDPIALLCSVELEADPLRRRLEAAAAVDLAGRRGWRGSLGGCDVVLLVAGMGKTNAAHSLTVLLERERVSGVIGFGVGGAYAGGGLAVGDLCLAAEEHYGDEGVRTPSGWVGCEAIGIPLLESGGGRFFNRFPADPAAVGVVAASLAAAGHRPGVGPFVTVSCCSGTAERGAELAARFGAVCETMEGAAYAHVATLYGLPWLGLRGVSNLVEDRDPSRWRLGEAAAAAAAAMPAAVAAWADHLAAHPPARRGR